MSVPLRHDLLLEWVSERGEGSWPKLREAHTWLRAESEVEPWETASLIARQMSALGHLELDWRRSRWAACPPMLTLLPSAGAHALLTGGRTRELLDRLAAAKEERGDIFCLDPIEQALAPSALLIACDDERAMRDLASSLGIASSYSVASQLAGVLPDLDSYLHQAATTPAPSGYGVQMLGLERLDWSDVEDDRDQGLYRYEAPAGRRFRYVDGSGTSHEVDLAIGTYAALRESPGRGWLKWFRKSLNGDLEVRLRAPLPTLHARAAALCSGLAPMHRGSCLVYVNVPKAIALALARSLAQELTVVD
jgi:hypothetical protein